MVIKNRPKKITYADPASNKSKNAHQAVYFHDISKLGQTKSVLVTYLVFIFQDPHQTGCFGVLKWLYLAK